MFGPAAHADILNLLIQVAVLLFTARLLGEVMQRFGHPAVVGEILAGVLLGPSFLSAAMPAVGAVILPQTPVQGHLLEVFGLIGAILLLVITGMEIDIPLVRRHFKTALTIGVFELVIPFGLGFWMAGLLPDSMIANPDRRIVFQLFVGTAMAISAIPVMAKVLMDMNLLRRNIGQTIMAIGMLDDTVAWLMLSVVIVLAGEGDFSWTAVVFSVAEIIVFITLTFTVGRYFILKLFNVVQDRGISRERILTLVVGLALLFGAVAQSLHIEAVLGAFLVGIIFGTIRGLPGDVVQKLESTTIGFFAPVFFAIAGLKVDLRTFSNPEVLTTGLWVIGIASLGKLGGAFIGAQLAGLDRWKALAFGSALNARGAVEIIIASIGLRLNILTTEMYTLVVIMAVATSVMAPFMLRFAMKRVSPDPDEVDRLGDSGDKARSFVASIQRVLMPVRTRFDSVSGTQRVAASILQRISKNGKLNVSMLSIAGAEFSKAAQTALDHCARLMPGVAVQKKVMDASRPAEAILDEAHKQYDLMVLGATERSDVLMQANLFNPMVDYLVRTAPCPTLVVQASGIDETWQPNRILVPVSGTVASRNATELAFTLASDPGCEIILLHVIVDDPGEHLLPVKRKLQAGEEQVGGQILADAQKRAAQLKIMNTPLLKRGASVEAVILEVAARNGVDMIVLGTSVRPGTDRLFLGPRVERILYLAQSPVLLVNS